MIRPKLRTTKRLRLSKRPVIYLALLAVLLTSGLSLVPLQPNVSAATVDCSDVFTPLSTFVTDGVNANKSFYVQAMNETGVPWEMLAAIHYRETNFSHTNPSNGQGIFQFASGAGGPYPTGPVSDGEFYRQLKFMATKIQTDYVYRNTPNAAANVSLRPLTAGEQDINLIKNTLYSYNGRSTEYANQGTQYGYNPTTQPFEGSPYVMNRFDCPRARMGIITQDNGSIDSTDTRYGTFTIFARLRGDSYWLAMTQRYSWLLNSEQLFADPNRSVALGFSTLAPSTTYYVQLTARNIGSSTWTNSGSNPVLVGTYGPGNRTSVDCNNSWRSCSRPTILQEASVAPGQIGTFNFSITTPSSYGIDNEYFDLVAEGASWMNDIGMYLPLRMVPPTNSWRPTSQVVYSDAGHTITPNTRLLNPNTTYYLAMQVVNTGNTTWSNSGNNPVRLGTTNPTDRASTFCDNTWVNCNRPTTMVESSVGPGQTATFSFSVKTPNRYGSFNEYFNLVAEGSAWMNDVGFYWPLTVSPPVTQWQYQGQTAYTDSSKSTTLDTSSVAGGSSFYSTIRALNTGNTTWTNSGNNPVRLGATNPTDRASAFCDNSWVSCNRPAVLAEASVVPGQTGSFNFWMHVPYGVNGTHFNEYFEPVVEGSMWMNDVGFYWPVGLQSSSSAWQYQGQSAYSDSAHTQPVDLGNATVNTTYYLQLKAKNVSGQVWSNSGGTPLRLGTPNNQVSAFCDNTWVGTGCNRATSLAESSVAPGQIGTFNFSIRTPSSAVNTQLYLRPVIDGSLWLDDVGLYWPIVTH